MANEDAHQAAAHWGDDQRAALLAEGGLAWSQLPAVQARINEKISGSPDRDWIDHLMATQLSDRWPVQRSVSICCYEGRAERALAQRGAVRHCLGLDISEGALRRARQLAEEADIDGLEFACQDINSLSLEPATYDVIFSHHALHHIVELEHVLDEMARALKPHGLLVIDEYVGPSRFQYPDRQIELCNAALRLLPERYRRSVSWQRVGRVGLGASRTRLQWLRLAWLKVRNRTLLEALTRRLRHRHLQQTSQVCVKNEVPRIQASEMAIDDPSEAVRSGDMLPLIRERFEVLDERPYGGTLLHPVLNDIAGNFIADDPQSMELLQMLFTIEDALLASGEIVSDFAYLVAKPKG